MTTKISQLPASQAISAASGNITLDKCVIGSSTPLAATVTTLTTTGDVTIGNGSAIHGDTTVAHTWRISARDTDENIWRDFITFTNASLPTMEITADTAFPGRINGVSIGVDNAKSGRFSVLESTSTLVTAPTDSHTATTAFGNNITLGTPLRNTTGYDILVTIGITVTAATAATLVMGVGSSATPTTDTVTPSFSTTGVIGLSAIVPNNYYLSLNKTGTLVSTNNIVVTPL